MRLLTAVWCRDLFRKTASSKKSSDASVKPLIDYCKAVINYCGNILALFDDATDSLEIEGAFNQFLHNSIIGQCLPLTLTIIYSLSFKEVRDSARANQPA